MQRGLYQSKVTFSLAAIQRPGLLAHNFKMAYLISFCLEIIKTQQCNNRIPVVVKLYWEATSR